MSLDRVVILGRLDEICKVIEELKDRVIKLEVDASVLESGYYVIYNALEINGLMCAGEATVPGAKTEQKSKKESSTVKEEATPRSIKLPFKAENISWITKTGPRGPFELSNDYNNLDHKALLEFLKTHAGGAIVSQGFYYWIFPDAKTVGRKPSNQVQRRGKS
jgi:hypothetical protein